LQRAADQAGLKAGEPWPVDKLLGAMGRRDDNNSSSSSNNSSSGEKPRSDGSPMSTVTPSSTTTSASTTSAAPVTSSSSGSSLPKVPILGFGEKDGGIKIPTFAPAPLGGVAPVVAGGSTTQYDERIVSRVNDMLKEADTNRNGYLDPDEIRAYRNWSTPPEESDLDKDGRLSRTELLERIAKRYASRGSRSDSSSRGSQSQPVDTAAQSRKYAEGLLQKYDANKSGYLEKDEWKELKPEYQAADINKDGVISTDELVTRLNALNSGQGGSSASSSNSGNGSSGYSRYGSRDRGSDRSGRSSEKEAKKPLIRALTPTERLPKGLPDWFLRNDADADGQVSMVEYAAAWSEKTAAEFQKYDLNRDGIITADEVLTVDKDSKSTTRSR
jgi:Ca2+-binding EF-hand superfamily protein